MGRTTSWRMVLLAGALAAALGATGAQAACADVYRFDAKPRLGVDDIARLRSGHDAKLGDDWLRWTPFDPRPAPDKDGWRKIALVAAGETGSGVTSLGGVLWARKLAQVGGRIVTQPRGLEAVFESVAGVCPEGFVFRLQADGVVSAGGVKLGSTRGAP